MNSFTLVFGSCAKKIQQRRNILLNFSRIRFHCILKKRLITAPDKQNGEKNDPISEQPHCYTFVSYFRVFQMSASSCMFGLTALNLGCNANFDMIFLVIGFICLITKIEYLLINIHHFQMRSTINITVNISVMNYTFISRSSYHYR